MKLECNRRYFVSKAANYDFTTNVNKAFGSNQVISGGIVSIYQGDANQDGFVNSGDLLYTIMQFHL
ncbi:MAG: hypothetical protein R2942_14690 [Ignavibacteria bacterium]